MHEQELAQRLFLKMIKNCSENSNKLCWIGEFVDLKNKTGINGGLKSVFHFKNVVHNSSKRKEWFQSFQLESDIFQPLPVQLLMWLKNVAFRNNGLRLWSNASYHATFMNFHEDTSYSQHAIYSCGWQYCINQFPKCHNIKGVETWRS